MAFGHQRTESSRILLREIAQAGPIPRIDLSERTGISRATVTTVTAGLLRGGLIEEVQRTNEPDSGRGRPKVDLRISGPAHHVVGVKVADTALSCVLMDFDGKEVSSITRPLAPGAHEPGALADELAATIDALADNTGLAPDRISGVGVGLAGLVQAETGLVYWSPSFSARNVNFRDTLEARMNRPVFVDNDANLVAMAELTFGMGRERSDFIVVTIESGVGMGIVLGGALYRGKRGSGGEFGHTKVQLEGALCRCGQRGCLEAYVADYALHREAISVGLVPVDQPTETSVASVIRSAREGNALALNVMARAGRMFAMGLANLVNVLDPELIILAGAQFQSDHLYEDTVLDQMRKSIVDIDRPAPEVVVHQWGDRMWALGAAAYALEYVRDIAVEALGNAG